MSPKDTGTPQKHKFEVNLEVKSEEVKSEEVKSEVPTAVNTWRNKDLTASSSHLIAPHGGELVQLQVPAARAAELKAHSKDWPSWDLSARQLCDLELLMSGGFSPLRGFMNRADYEGVCHNMRLANGTLWPMPITLDVDRRFCQEAHARLEQDRAARSRRRDARRPSRRRCVAARPEGRSAVRVWFHQRRAPRR